MTYRRTQGGTGLFLFLLAWTILTVCTMMTAVRVSGEVLPVLVLPSLTFLFLRTGALQEATSMSKFGGSLGILTAVAAWHATLPVSRTTGLAVTLSSGRR